MEGVMTGVIAASIALSLLVIAYPPAVRQFRSDIAFIPLSYDPTFLASLARDLLLGGSLLGAVASYTGVRRFVKLGVDKTSRRSYRRHSHAHPTLAAHPAVDLLLPVQPS